MQSANDLRLRRGSMVSVHCSGIVGIQAGATSATGEVVLTVGEHQERGSVAALQMTTCLKSSR